MMLGFIPPGLCFFILLILMVPYIGVLCWKPSNRQVDAPNQSNLNSNIRAFKGANWIDGPAIILTLSAIIFCSRELIKSTVIIGQAWEISHTVLGTVILAALTGIPNLIAALQLSRHKKGESVVSETYNSNTLNLIVGLIVPAWLISNPIVSHSSQISLIWLFGLTVLTMVMGVSRKGLNRTNGIWIIAIYLVYISLLIF
jgi:cation:H+ antiporter